MNCGDGTSDQVILTAGNDDTSTVICHDITTGVTSRYSMESSITSLIAFEEYAFMVLTDWDSSKNLDEQQHQVYRICLSNGEREQITVVTGTVHSFVASDEYVYLYTSSGDGALYRYDCNGEYQIAGNL